MPGLNLSRSEAAERSAHLYVHSYDVVLDLTTSEENFYSKTVARFSCNAPGYDTFIDAVGKSIISATLNGQALDVTDFDGESLFLKNLAAENELIVEMEAVYSKTGEGLQRSVDPADNQVYLYSQGEIADIRRMFVCFDQPDLKATFTLTATAPAHWELISNNPVAHKVDAGDEKTTWTFTTTPRMPTYIAVLVAGPYHRFSDEYVGKKVIPLGLYVRKSLAEFADPDDIFLLTKQGFAYFERVMGLVYPFEKYDQIAVVDFNAGAMENAGAVTYAESSFIFRSKVTNQAYGWRANVIFHEMAHMWFGDMVTMQWWDDLWLNESFAEWACYAGVSEGTRFKDCWVTFNTERKDWGYREDQRNSTHPIVTDMEDLNTVAANFDGISYAKGASVLQQLDAHVGRENFIAGLQQYFAKHAWKNTTLKDLLDELEATSGRDLSSWSKAWLQTAGVNTLRPVLEIVDGKYSAVSVAQEYPVVPEGSTELRPHRLAVGLYDLKDDVLALRKSVELDLNGKLTPVAELVGEPVADLLLVNDRDLTYAKIRFDDRSIETLKNHLRKIQDPLARVLCWSAAWDMLRYADLSASDYITLAIEGLKTETDITIVTRVMGNLSAAGYRYSHPSHKSANLARVSDGLEYLMDNALAGSDLQLQYARSFAAMAYSDNQRARVRQLMSGSLGGLAIDADLRWHFVNTLVERGLLGKPELDEELAKDNTFSGQLSYDQAIAALPTAESKSQTWEDITTKEMGTSTRSAVITGFVRPLQLELLEPYIDKYFDALMDIWGMKSYEVARRFVMLLYPNNFIGQATLDKTLNWLEVTGKDAHPTLRRLVIDGLDEMKMSIKAQSKDA